MKVRIINNTTPGSGLTLQQLYFVTGYICGKLPDIAEIQIVQEKDTPETHTMYVEMKTEWDAVHKVRISYKDFLTGTMDIALSLADDLLQAFIWRQ